MGASKLLRDFAWGLASEGIATLRYEKRLADQDVPDEELTLDAVVDDAVAALAELAAIDRVAEEALFVAGHSQGGMAAPRIAAQHGSVAGVVILDGRADSTLDPDDLDFMRYEFEPDGDLSDAQEAELDRERETARRTPRATSRTTRLSRSDRERGTTASRRTTLRGPQAPSTCPPSS